ncbi:Hypothetical predicted protein [Cloeon dipterum]|uniref:Uncharacterized protein n=1 Tax=Cloeon dipterum TaxID=197152 RepID=A0A8S1CML8_9INSE|nr:Hypothetical predicted protein [Cloeon dipterum]
MHALPLPRLRKRAEWMASEAADGHTDYPNLGRNVTAGCFGCWLRIANRLWKSETADADLKRRACIPCIPHEGGSKSNPHARTPPATRLLLDLLRKSSDEQRRAF